MNNLESLVYEGVWEKYNRPFLQRSILTLRNIHGVLILACLAILFTVTQSRSWSLIQLLVATRKKSVRLEGDSAPDPLRTVSQTEAILCILPYIENKIKNLRIRFRRIYRSDDLDTSSPSNYDNFVISPVFGIFCIINITLFLILGAAVPYLISEGTFGSPVVRSRMTERCLKRELPNWRDLMEDQIQPGLQGMFQLCRGGLENGCGQSFLQQPQISRRRLKSCMFRSVMVGVKN